MRTGRAPEARRDQELPSRAWREPAPVPQSWERGDPGYGPRTVDRGHGPSRPDHAPQPVEHEHAVGIAGDPPLRPRLPDHLDLPFQSFAPVVEFLRQASQDPQVLAAQSLLLSPSDIVESAGWVFLAENGVATPYLQGHPLEDALQDGGRDLAALSRDALAMRAEDLVALPAPEKLQDHALPLRCSPAPGATARRPRDADPSRPTPARAP